MSKYGIDLEQSIKEIKENEQKNIKVFIENALNFEKENKIGEAIKNYEEVFSMYEFREKDNEIFELYMKVGELCQISGQIGNGLKYFELAYETAVILEDKFFQVDALAKVADSYLSLGDLETGIKYADIANSILSEIDYIKGKIEMSIYWSRTNYIKKDFYKARDICNEALRLCGDEYLFYKGRILTTQVELYKDITSVDEHLDLLNKAYECFEKVNYTRGMLGVINNIATVYGDKLQDYEKALEYLMKLKELSENSIYVEFNKVSYLNIGEAYYKFFKYKEALFWFEEALKNPLGAYMDNILVYNYANLSITNLKLYNYQQAYDSYIQAREELNKNSCTESTLVQYYKTAAELFIEFGENSKAISYIKKALDSVGKDETIIKWNVGFIYEFAKLREAKNESDIIEILEAIRYAISKYINKDEILDAIYDIALELISTGRYELAFDLIDEYSSIKSDKDSIRLKKIYFDIKQNEVNNCENIELLRCAIEFTIQTKNAKIHWKLCCSIGDFYVKENDLENAIIYFNEAFSIVKKMLLSVPEKYRLQFINSSWSLEPFNKLNYAKQQIDELNNENFNIYETVNSIEQLDEIFSVTQI